MLLNLISLPSVISLTTTTHTLLLLLLQTPLQTQTQCNLLSFSSPDPMPPECFSGTPNIMHPNTTNPLHGKKCLIKTKCIHNRRIQQNKNKNKCFFLKEESATILQQIPFFLCVRQDFVVCIVSSSWLQIHWCWLTLLSTGILDICPASQFLLLFCLLSR